MWLILEAWWWLVFRNCSIQAWDEGWNALISRDFHECMVYWQNTYIKIVVLGWFNEWPMRFAQGPNNLLFKVRFYLFVCVNTLFIAVFAPCGHQSWKSFLLHDFGKNIQVWISLCVYSMSYVMRPVETQRISFTIIYMGLFGTDMFPLPIWSLMIVYDKNHVWGH